MTPIVDPKDIALYSKCLEVGYLTKEFVDRFDVILIMATSRILIKNWPTIKHKLVIWRTVGLSNSITELSLKYYRSNGLKIIRYSPSESKVPDYLGHDRIIRFSKYPSDFHDWVGNRRVVINVARDISNRSRIVHFNIWKLVTRGLPKEIYGPDNESLEDSRGCLSYSELLSTFRDCRVFFSLGTSPAPYTLGFLEAWMSGIPVVAIGPKLANIDFNTYEVSSLIENGVSGFYSDNLKELRNYITFLLFNASLAKRISDAAVIKARSIFSVDVIKPKWIEFFNTFLSI